VLEVSERDVVVHNMRLSLSRTDRRLLHLLLSRAGAVVTKDEMARSVWSRTLDRQRGFVDTALSRLKRKLGPAALGFESAAGGCVVRWGRCER
jgi:DNA-binding response OmpR family regulator